MSWMKEIDEVGEFNGIMTKRFIEDPRNYCLVLTIEGAQNTNNKRRNKTFEFPKRDYFQEALICINTWRKRAAWLKDIKIIIHNPSKDLSKVDKKKLIAFGGVVYIHEPIPEIHKYDYGFVNVHYTGQFIESHKEAKPIMIHIDLDMETLQAPEPEFFYPLEKKEAIVGSYRPGDYGDQRVPVYNPFVLLNTDLIVTKAKGYKGVLDLDGTYNQKSLDFSMYSSFINGIDTINNDVSAFKELHQEKVNTWKEDNPYVTVPDSRDSILHFREYDIEEYGCDLAYDKHSDLIHLIKEDGYEQGEGYQEEENTKCYWWHQHLVPDPDPKLFQQKVRLINRIRRSVRSDNFLKGEYDGDFHRKEAEKKQAEKEDVPVPEEEFNIANLMDGMDDDE